MDVRKDFGGANAVNEDEHMAVCYARAWLLGVINRISGIAQSYAAKFIGASDIRGFMDNKQSFLMDLADCLQDAVMAECCPYCHLHDLMCSKCEYKRKTRGLQFKERR
jgi:hypothetical protein